MDLTKAGQLEGVNSAEELVAKLENLSQFKQTDQSRFLDAKIIKRKYHLLSRERVQPFIDAEEKVNQLPGVSKIHQAFSTGERGKLLVRSRICCCKPCLKRNWQNCELKEYVEAPTEVQFSFKKAVPGKSVNRAPPPTLIVQDGEVTEDLTQFVLTLGSVYAMKAEDGFTLIRLRSKAGEMVQGEVLKKAEETFRKKDSIQYVVTEEVVEAISSDIISEVDMDREMRLSQRIVNELLSIYM